MGFHYSTVALELCCVNDKNTTALVLISEFALSVTLCPSKNT